MKSVYEVVLEIIGSEKLAFLTGKSINNNKDKKIQGVKNKKK